MRKEVEHPSKEEFAEWRRSVVGEWVFDVWLADYISEMTGDLVQYHTIDKESVESTALKTMEHLTKINTVYNIVQSGHEEIMANIIGDNVEESDDEESHDG